MASCVNCTESPAHTVRVLEVQSDTGMHVGRGTVAPVATKLDGDVRDPRRLKEFNTAQARERWSNIRMRPAAAGLVTRFETVLTDMEKAVSAQNVPHARASAKAELDMVDELESVFQHVDSSKS